MELIGVLVPYQLCHLNVVFYRSPSFFAAASFLTTFLVQYFGVLIPLIPLTISCSWASNSLDLALSRKDATSSVSFPTSSFKTLWRHSDTLFVHLYGGSPRPAAVLIGFSMQSFMVSNQATSFDGKLSLMLFYPASKLSSSS